MSEQMARVVHVDDCVPGAVYIGRAVPRRRLPNSPFGNPFRIGTDGARHHVITKFQNHIDGALRSHRGPEIAEALIALRGKPLACWCRHDGEAPTPGNACHGDCILSLLERYTDDELRALATQD